MCSDKTNHRYSYGSGFRQPIVLYKLSNGIYLSSGTITKDYKK